MSVTPAEIMVGLMAMIITALALYTTVRTIARLNIVGDLVAGINLLPIALWLGYSQLTGQGGNFVELVAANARRNPNKEALVFTADGRRYTYKQLNDEINRTASWMISQGIKPTDMVALIMENTPEFIFIWMAALKVCFHSFLSIL
jgi:non-ribosomal peptide synthetase component F